MLRHRNIATEAMLLEVTYAGTRGPTCEQLALLRRANAAATLFRAVFLRWAHLLTRRHCRGKLWAPLKGSQRPDRSGGER